MNKFYDEIEKFKQLLRRGWQVRFDGKKHRLESDAEHIFSTQMLALKIINDKKLNLDVEKVLKLLLLHELGEIDAGDFIPMDNISREEKHNKEKVGVERLTQVFNNNEFMDIWQEFEDNQTNEAIFARKIDKLDAVMQAKRYAEKFGAPQVYDEFFNTSKDVIKEFLEYLK